jgi:hypothetical protein
VFATIGDVINIKHSGAKFDEIETTQYNSPTDANGSLIKEFMFGTKDPGSVDLELSYTTQDTQDLLEAAEGTAVNFELHFPQLTSVTFLREWREEDLQRPGGRFLAESGPEERDQGDLDAAHHGSDHYRRTAVVQAATTHKPLPCPTLANQLGWGTSLPREIHVKRTREHRASGTCS